MAEFLVLYFVLPYISTSQHFRGKSGIFIRDIPFKVKIWNILVFWYITVFLWLQWQNTACKLLHALMITVRPFRLQPTEDGGTARAGEEGSLWQWCCCHTVPSYRRRMQRQWGRLVRVWRWRVVRMITITFRLHYFCTLYLSPAVNNISIFPLRLHSSTSEAGVHFSVRLSDFECVSTLYVPVTC